MTDLCEKGLSSGSETIKKSCADCQTSKTPLWRGGPAGPKSLCNACGIRYRKRRRANLSQKKEGSDKKKTERIISSNNNINNTDFDSSLKIRLLNSRKEMMSKRSTMESHIQLGEEEQAAFLLMALSCGSVYA